MDLGNKLAYVWKEKKKYYKIKVLYIISKKQIPISFYQTGAQQFASLKGGRIVSFTNTKCHHIIQYRILNSETPYSISLNKQARSLIKVATFLFVSHKMNPCLIWLSKALRRSIIPNILSLRWYFILL